MSRPKAIHQIMPGFLYGDAVGNQAFRIRALLRQWGYQSQVYAQFRDSRLADPGLDYTRYAGRRDTIVIFHYSIGSPVTAFVRSLPDRIVPYYHNVTPPEFVQRYNADLTALLAQGQRELVLFEAAPFALAASEYNRQEMLRLGFQHVAVLPYFLYFDELLASMESAAGRAVVQRYGDGWVNILFVGRIVANKRQDDLIRAFHYYHRLINPQSRLLLVGSDSNAPGYRLELDVLTDVLGLAHVHLVGPVGLREGLGGYYRAASVYLSLSEHEGFGVPLLEAMRFDVPVLAFNATGVPYALGDAGVLFNRKRYDAIGETIDMVTRDDVIRRQLLVGQQQRLAQLSPAVTTELLRTIVDEMAT
ncbi:MAG: glycosyltransferase family 4 protein [Chloroflexota bacterium]